MEEKEGNKGGRRPRRSPSGWREIAKFAPKNDKGKTYFSQTVSRASRTGSNKILKDWLEKHGIHGELPADFDIYEWKKEYGFLAEGEEKPKPVKVSDKQDLEFGEFLRTTRNEILQMSQARLGELVNTTASHVNRWERGFKPVKSTQFLLFDQIIKVCDEGDGLYNKMPKGWANHFTDEYKEARGWVPYTDETDDGSKEVLVPPYFANVFEKEPLYRDDTVVETHRVIKKKTLRTKDREKTEFEKYSANERARRLAASQGFQLQRFQEEVKRNEKRIIGLEQMSQKLDSKLDSISQMVTERSLDQRDEMVTTQSKYITMLEEKIQSLEAEIAQLKVI